jgi:hypothetical protein
MDWGKSTTRFKVSTKPEQDQEAAPKPLVLGCPGLASASDPTRTLISGRAQIDCRGLTAVEIEVNDRL